MNTGNTYQAQLVHRMRMRNDLLNAKCDHLRSKLAAVTDLLTERMSPDETLVFSSSEEMAKIVKHIIPDD